MPAGGAADCYGISRVQTRRILPHKGLDAFEATAKHFPSCGPRRTKDPHVQEKRERICNDYEAPRNQRGGHVTFFNIFL